MEISVLATKCRYCGESVGRPQVATRSLSIDDLGGETVRHYAPSSNVMDALETFRAEEVVPTISEEPKGEKTLFGRKKVETPAKPAQNTFGLPELDARSQDLANIGLTSTTVRRAVKKQRPAWMDKLVLALKGLAALAVLFVAIRYGYPAVKGMLYKPEVKEAVHNRAPDLIAAGAPTIQILGAAREAALMDDSTENQKIRADARGMVIKEVESLLNTRDFNMSNLDKARSLAREAANMDPSPDLMALQNTVNEEQRAYRLTFVGTTEEGGVKKGNFTIVASSSGQPQTVTAAVGETVDERFVVTSLTSTSCRLKDTVRNGREFPAPSLVR